TPLMIGHELVGEGGGTSRDVVDIKAGDKVSGGGHLVWGKGHRNRFEQPIVSAIGYRSSHAGCRRRTSYRPLPPGHGGEDRLEHAHLPGRGKDVRHAARGGDLHRRALPEGGARRTGA